MGANIHCRYEYDDWISPLDKAILNDHIDVLQVLLEHGANIHCVDTDREGSPLEVATGLDRVNMVRLLLNHGADVLTVPTDQNVLLYICGGIDMVHLLLDHGAEVNCRDTYGQTPLSNAFMNGHTDVIRMLFCTMGPRLCVPTMPDGCHYMMLLRFVTSMLSVSCGTKGPVLTAWTMVDLHHYIRPVIVVILFDSCWKEEQLYNAEIVLVKHRCTMPPSVMIGMTRKKTPVDVVSVLLDSGSNVNCKDNQGLTPLHTLFISGCCDHDVVNLLDIGEGRCLYK